MKRLKSIISVMFLLIVFFFSVNTTSAITFNNPNYVERIDSIGEVKPPFNLTTIQNPTLSIVNTCTDPVCYGTDAVQGYLFSYTATIWLPKVGATIDGGYVNQEFHDSTLQHENWHYAYIVALANATYGALETWSAAYKNRWFESPGEASESGYEDLDNALALAEQTYQGRFYDQVTTFEYTNYPNNDSLISYAIQYDDPETGWTWQSVNPDWGQEAVNYASGTKVNFTTTPGTAICPEPSTILLLGLGFSALVIFRRKALLIRTCFFVSRR